jgi:hypothetical protein
MGKNLKVVLRTTLMTFQGLTRCRNKSTGRICTILTSIDQGETHLCAKYSTAISIENCVCVLGISIDVTVIILHPYRLAENSPSAELFSKLVSNRSHPCNISLERTDSIFSVSICTFSRHQKFYFCQYKHLAFLESHGFSRKHRFVF